MHTCVALRHNIDESKFSCYTNRYCVVCSNVLKGHHTIGQNKRVVNGPALGNINCRFLTVHQFSLFWMCLVSKNWWIGEIERNERKLRGQVEGREEEWKRAKLPPPVSLYTVLSLFFGWLFVWLSSWRKNLCWISKFATGFQKFHFCMRSNDFTIHNCIFLSETSQELDQVNSANLLFKFSSFARGRSIRMTICKRPVHPNDRFQDAGPSGWS